MRTKKYIATIACASALALTLCACGSSAASSSQASEGSSAAASSASASAVESSSASSNAAASEEQGDVYSNEYFGFAYVAPDGISMLDDAELAAEAQDGGFAASADELDDNERALDMMAVDSTGDYKVQVIIQNFGEGVTVTAEEYSDGIYEAAAAKLSQISDSLDEWSIRQTDLEVEGVSIPADVSMMKQGDATSVEIATYLVNGNYGATVIFTAPTEDEALELAQGLSLTA